MDLVVKSWFRGPASYDVHFEVLQTILQVTPEAARVPKGRLVSPYVEVDVARASYASGSVSLELKAQAHRAFFIGAILLSLLTCSQTVSPMAASALSRPRRCSIQRHSNVSTHSASNSPSTSVRRESSGFFFRPAPTFWSVEVGFK